MNYEQYIKQFVASAIAEDVGDGDHTSLACIPAGVQGKARLLVKQNGVLAGVSVARQILAAIDNSLKVETFIEDGTLIKVGDVAFTISGSVHSILKAERLVLNVMQRMSGIATETRRYVDCLAGLKTRILDTRKTTPGMRLLEKMAVKLGGGENHRIGLYDMIMIKDNHVDFAGGIEAAILATHQYLQRTGKDLKIEIEARNIADVKEILRVKGVQRIMLDNFSIEDTRKAVQLIPARFETESSGGITIENIRQYAECGVDFISVGALTHQIKSLDLSLKAMF